MRIVSIKHLVVLHTDLRLYWMARLKALNSHLFSQGIKLTIVEIAGKGSPYSFEMGADKDATLDWQVLFPEIGIEAIDPRLSQKAIAKKLKELNPDLVMAGALAFPSGAGALKWKQKTGKPIILFDDARPEDVQRNWFVNTLKYIFYQNVDAIICPAPSHARGFSRWGLKYEEIFYGIDVIDNQLFAKKKEEARVSDTSARHQPYLLAIGRQVEKKNWLTLIRAFILYKSTNPTSQLNLLFVGDGPLHQELVEMVDAGNRFDILFVPFVQQKEIIQFYHQARGLILPSRFGETWGLVVNEAMAAGLPVLVSKECGCAETLVQEEVNGWTFDPDSISGISAAIEKLDHLTQEKWQQMSNSSENLIKDWDLTRFTKGVLDAIEYLSRQSKVKNYWVGKFLIHFWKGRYRPS